MRLINHIQTITCCAGWVGAALIFPLVGVLVYEVFSRYVLGNPTPWAFEISYMLMGAIFMLGLANALRTGQHVSVDVVSERLPEKINSIIKILAFGALLPIFIWMSWELSKYAITGYLSSERSGRSAWNPVMWPIYSVWLLGISLLALQVVAEILKATVSFLPNAKNNGEE